jgi:hypothetical protein
VAQAERGARRLTSQLEQPNSTRHSRWQTRSGIPALVRCFEILYSAIVRIMNHRSLCEHLRRYFGAQENLRHIPGVGSSFHDTAISSARDLAVHRQDRIKRKGSF